MIRVAGDVGGTKTVLAAIDGAGAVIREQAFPSQQHATFAEIVETFAAGERVSSAAFGVAGPVANRVAQLTNLPWVIDARALEASLGHVVLMNDLQATALGMLDVPADRWHELQAGPRPDHAPIAVVAPGTGFGQAVLVRGDGGHYRALATEAGHADFAPSTDDEIELLRYLRAKYGGHVSYERVLSGNGFGDLYDFLLARGGTTPPPWLQGAMAAGDRNAAITEAALAGTSPTCVQALAMFVAMLGAETGNAALRAMAAGGVAIGGGIPPKILPALDAHFLARFRAKGRFEPWMRGLSVRVCLEPRAALLGAMHAVRELS